MFKCASPIRTIFVARQEDRNRFAVHYQQRLFSVSVEVTTRRDERLEILPSRRCMSKLRTISTALLSSTSTFTTETGRRKSSGTTRASYRSRSIKTTSTHRGRSQSQWRGTTYPLAPGRDELPRVCYRPWMTALGYREISG